MIEKKKQEPPKLVRLGNSEVLADAWNSRLKLLDYKRLDMEFLDLAFNYARLLGFGKIIAYVPDTHADLMSRAGYEFEGEIAGYLNGRDVWCCSRFLNRERQMNTLASLENGILDECYLKSQHPVAAAPEAFVIRGASESDVPAMIELFKDVFLSYPGPIFDEAYLRHQMSDNSTIYHLAARGGEIIGIASAEIDRQHLNAELGDCATTPESRGLGVMRHLLASLETVLEILDIKCCYSLARAAHAPINQAFYGQGFQYSGRMIKNCQICGSFEDMNIWVKNRLV